MERIAQGFGWAAVLGVLNEAVRAVLRTRGWEDQETKRFASWFISFAHSGRSAWLSMAALKTSAHVLDVLKDVDGVPEMVTAAIPGMVDRALPWSMGYFMWDLYDMPRSGTSSAAYVIHHWGVLVGCVIVMTTEKCQPFLFSALMAELNTAMLTIRAMLKILQVDKSKSQPTRLAYWLITWPPLLASYLYSRVYIHGLVMRQSVRMLANPHSPESGMPAWQYSALGCYGVGVGVAIAFINVGLLHSLIRADIMPLVRAAAVIREKKGA